MNEDLDFVRDDLELHDQLEHQIEEKANKRPKIKVRGLKRIKRSKSTEFKG